MKDSHNPGKITSTTSSAVIGPLAVVREIGSLDLNILVALLTVLESLPTMSWSVPVSPSHFSIPTMFGIAVKRAHDGTCSPTTVLHFVQHKSSGPSGECSQRKSHAGSSVSIETSICLSDSAAKMASLVSHSRDFGHSSVVRNRFRFLLLFTTCRYISFQTGKVCTSGSNSKRILFSCTTRKIDFPVQSNFCFAFGCFFQLPLIVLLFPFESVTTMVNWSSNLDDSTGQDLRVGRNDLCLGFKWCLINSLPSLENSQ